MFMLSNVNRKILRPVQVLLVAFFVYAVGVQCCQSSLSVFASPQQDMACHTSSQNNHHEDTASDDQSSEKDCHCTYNPAQLSWAGSERIETHALQCELTKYTLLLTLQQAYAVKDKAEISTELTRPPPLSTPLFIASTILLI